MANPNIPRDPVERAFFATLDGKAKREDVALLVRTFLNETRGAPTPESMFVRDALHCWLRGKDSLDRCFRLKGKRGAPARMDDKNLKAAVGVVRKMLKGETAETAIESVAKEYHRSERQVQAAYVARRQDAVIAVRTERPDSKPWTEKERERLCRMLEPQKKLLRLSSD